MTLLVLTGLMLLMLAAMLLRFRGLSILLGTFALLWLFAVGSGFIPYFLLRSLQFHPQLNAVDWLERNAIVILGGGSVAWDESDAVRSHTLVYSRLAEGVRLYRLCKLEKRICLLLPTGGDPKKLGVSEAEIMGRELADIGVDPRDVLLEAKSNNTFQNAQFTADLVKKHELQRIVLVTSGIHVPRSLLYFGHFVNDILASPADRLAPNFSCLPRSMNFALADLAIHERIGVQRYHLYNWMGWNPASRPVAGAP